MNDVYNDVVGDYLRAYDDTVDGDAIDRASNHG